MDLANTYVEINVANRPNPRKVLARVYQTASHNTRGGTGIRGVDESFSRIQNILPLRAGAALICGLTQFLSMSSNTVKQYKLTISAIGHIANPMGDSECRTKS
jgi:hypothetical protein